MNKLTARIPARNRSLGVSLIELMIGMTLGLVVLGAVLYVFAGNRASYRHQEALSAVQEAGRFALEVISYDLRMAGYAGCGNIAYGQILAGVFDNTDVIQGGVNTVTIKRGEPFVAFLDSISGNDVTLQNIGLLADQPAALHDDQLLITDCTYYEIFSVADLASGGVDAGNHKVKSTGPLARVYQRDSQVMPYRQVVYQVVDEGLRRNGQELVQGVQRLQITYGVDQTDNRMADLYEAAPGDWRRVVSVKVAIDLQQDGMAGPLTFVNTVTLRNRVP